MGGLAWEAKGARTPAQRKLVVRSCSGDWGSEEASFHTAPGCPLRSARPL